MKIYRIADLNIGVKSNYEYTENLMKDYLLNQEVVPDFSIIVTQEMIDFEKSLISGFNEYYYENIAVLRAICKKILSDYNGFFLHCSCLELNNQAFIFTAPSGTGKSTHTALWRKHFGKSVTMINDDKPIVRLENGVFYIYGTPWQGKSDIGNNIKVPVHAICILKQGKENKIKKLTSAQSLKFLFNQTERPRDYKSMDNLLSMLDKLLNTVPIYLLECTISDEAVITAYEAMK